MDKIGCNWHITTINNVNVTANQHSLESLANRNIDITFINNTIKKVNFNQIAISETIGIIDRITNKKLLAVKSGDNLLFIITGLTKNQYLKNGTKAIYV